MSPETTLHTIQKILIANRGEIAIRIMRAATELHIRTISIYTYEDRYSLHRFKSDESYMIGEQDDPLRPYLDCEEIIALAKKVGADAIHPGYGFLSENVNFARRCKEEDLIFVGPSPDVMDQLGDKVKAKQVAFECNVPTIQGTKEPISSHEEAKAIAEKIGFPIILKAAAGGGGRGMRVVKDAESFENALSEAQNEAKRAFGNDSIFIEQFIDHPRHIEVQLLGDHYGNLVHLYERDCSIQRRFQKVVEVAPSQGLSDETRQKLYAYALALGNHVGYTNAGTVEFLIDRKEQIFFIEVNPRIQVEHTVTEEITGIDLVRSQILIAQGYHLHGDSIRIPEQAKIPCSGVAIQCRITTENPRNNFKPDYGRLISYRSPGGFGIRLDAGSAYDSARISPFFDSLLVKITAKGLTRIDAGQRLERALREFRIRGLNTNLPFLRNVIKHPAFLSGTATVNFIEDCPELFEFEEDQDTATKSLSYMGNLIVNGNPDIEKRDPSVKLSTPKAPSITTPKEAEPGTRQRLSALGREKFVTWLKQEKPIHYTDTTFRDAHQSLLATRFRTKDMLEVASAYAKANPTLFSMEMWGGATFDVALRFLHECPWERLKLLREAMPNILFQMLIRGNNAVGYTAYPENVIASFIENSAKEGIDIFRIFDSQNYMPNMKTSIQVVRDHTDSLAEVCMCYTGDLQDPSKTKFTLPYYLDLARQIEDSGAHILAIKDMAGLLKPFAAKTLITELKKVIDIPIHLHTHDSTSIQAATYLTAIEAGVDVVDVAMASVSGLTSQPSFNGLVAMMQGHERENPVSLPMLNRFSRYWEEVRKLYYPFESGLKTGSAEVYTHEIPGGQYSNLYPQARGLGLADKFDKVIQNYAEANALLGDIIKVTPSSKVVGDLAIFMTANMLSKEGVLAKADTLDFPESVKGFMRGDLGQPYGGFPPVFQKAVLKGESPNPKATQLAPLDLEKEFSEFQKQFPKRSSFLDFLSWCMYPQVFSQFYTHFDLYGPVSSLPTKVFFYGLEPREETVYDIGEGKTITISLLHVETPQPNGMRSVYFQLNGQTRVIDVLDKSLKIEQALRRKVSKDSDMGAPLQGKLYKILVEDGQKVSKNTPLFIIEAMKMETMVTASVDGTIGEIILKEGTMVNQDDVVLVLT